MGSALELSANGKDVSNPTYGGPGAASNRIGAVGQVGGVADGEVGE